MTEYLKLLFADMEYHLPVVTALAGSIPVQTFVDKADNPLAVIIKYKHRVYLAGEVDSAFLRRVFTEEVLPQAGADFIFVLYYAPDDWTPVIEDLLGGYKLIVAPRQYYRFAELRYDWRALLPKGFHVAMVDADLLSQTDLKNMDALREEMCSERLTVEDFLTNSFGTCVIHGDELVAWCLSEYNTDDRCEIGTETQVAYQQRGLATIAASALIEHAQTQGISEIGWHCYKRNVPSVATALKIGFEHVADYPAFVVISETDT